MQPECSVCIVKLVNTDYWRRETCGHHLCMACALPLIQANKTHCARCPPPRRPVFGNKGNLVLGTDSEQLALIEAELLAERQSKVGCLPDYAGGKACFLAVFGFFCSNVFFSAPFVYRCRFSFSLSFCFCFIHGFGICSCCHSILLLPILSFVFICHICSARCFLFHSTSFVSNFLHVCKSSLLPF